MTKAPRIIRVRFTHSVLLGREAASMENLNVGYEKLDGRQDYKVVFDADPRFLRVTVPEIRGHVGSFIQLIPMSNVSYVQIADE